MNSTERLLREFVRQELLLEDDIMATGYGDDLSSVFWEPVADAYKGIKGAMSKIGSSAQTVVKTVVQGIIGVMIPFLEADYRQIFAEEDSCHFEFECLLILQNIDSLLFE